jgi:hypothetical protein
MKHGHRIADRSNVLEISEASMCFEYSNRYGFLPGREMAGYFLDLESEMMSLEQSWQAMMATWRPLCWQLK